MVLVSENVDFEWILSWLLSQRTGHILGSNQFLAWTLRRNHQARERIMNQLVHFSANRLGDVWLSTCLLFKRDGGHGDNLSNRIEGNKSPHQLAVKNSPTYLRSLPTAETNAVSVATISGSVVSLPSENRIICRVAATDARAAREPLCLCSIGRARRPVYDASHLSRRTGRADVRRLPHWKNAR